MAALSLMVACNDESSTESPEADETTSPAPISYEHVEGAGTCETAADGATCSVEPTDNSLIMTVSGEWTPTDEVLVEYWNEDAGRLRTEPVSVEDGAYEVTLSRLRSETPYEFQVIGLDQGGEDVAGPTGDFETGTLPPGLRRAEFNVLEGESTSEVTFMDFNPNEFEGEAQFHGLIAIDSDAEIVWYFETGETNAMARRENGNIIYIDYTFGLREVTPLGEEVASLESECVPIVYHHEIEILPDGSVLTMGFDVRDTFGDEERLQVGDTVVRWDPATGETTELWSIHEFDDPAVNRTEASGMTEGFMWTGCDEDEPTEDWSHGNSVKRTPEGDFLVSFRHLNQVHSLTSDFGEVNWRLGGEGSDFEFADPNDRFYHQHSAIQFENGNVLLFDNGNFRPEDEGGEYSRAIEYELDTEMMTARKVWEYVPEPDIFSECCASVERLENGNTLILFPSDITSDLCCRVQTIVEADVEADTAWKVEASARGLFIIYRVYSGDSILGEGLVEEDATASG